MTFFWSGASIPLANRPPQEGGSLPASNKGDTPSVAERGWWSIVGELHQSRCPEFRFATISVVDLEARPSCTLSALPLIQLPTPGLEILEMGEWGLLRTRFVWEEEGPQRGTVPCSFSPPPLPAAIS